MPRRTSDEDDWDEDYDAESEDDYDPANEEQDDEEPTVPCPYCRQPIHEDSLRCPYCEKYLSEEDAPPATRPWWIIAGFVLCFVVIYLWLTGR
jgi:hypothetical protein